MPRDPIGDRPLTQAERSARYHEKQAAEREMMIEALRAITEAGGVIEARQIAHFTLCRVRSVERI